VINESNAFKRVEKKIDHLERSLVHKTPSLGKGASLAGRALGSMVGQGDLGAMAGEGLSKLFGWGDYRVAVKGNSLMSGISGNTVPKFVGDGKRGVRLTEREFIGNILSGAASGSSTVFDNHSYPLNPTNSTTFPWLSRIANLFDQWEPHGIVFEFHTTSSTFNGTSQALGAVIMATDYDNYDPAYSTKQIMENADYACSSVPSANLLHGVECDPSERPLQIMYTSERADQLNFSDLGTFQIATQGCSVAGVTLGELWISYDITFYKKQLEPPTITGPGYSVRGLLTNGGPPIIPTEIFYSQDIVLEQEVGYGSKILLPPNDTSGTYLMTYLLDTPSASPLQVAPVNLVNCSITTQSSYLTAGNFYYTVSKVLVTGQNASFKMTLSDYAGYSNFTIVQVPTGVNAVAYV
jgi:hypothetical protein